MSSNFSELLQIFPKRKASALKPFPPLTTLYPRRTFRILRNDVLCNYNLWVLYNKTGYILIFYNLQVLSQQIGYIFELYNLWVFYIFVTVKRCNCIFTTYGCILCYRARSSPILPCGGLRGAQKGGAYRQTGFNRTAARRLIVLKNIFQR